MLRLLLINFISKYMCLPIVPFTYCLYNEVTNSMGQSPSCGTSSHSADQEIPYFVGIPKVCCHVQMSLPLKL